MKKQLLSGIAFAIAFGISPQIAYAQTHSHLTDEELQKLMPDFQRQVDYWNQYEEPERQNEAKAFAENWSQRDPTVAPFLGKWAGWEETMDIYPSTTEGQVCIIYTSEPEASFSQVSFRSLGEVLNRQVYTDGVRVTIQQENYVGFVWHKENETGVNVYRLIAPAEVPSRESLSYWSEGDRVIEQFNAAGCIAEASNQESRRCVTWEEVKSEVESLYNDHPLPELPDGFKNGCVFGDNGSYIIAISVFKEGMRPPISQVNDTLFGTSIPKFFSIDLGYAIDENWDSLRFYNVCGSVGTSSTSFCQNMPTDEVFIKEGLVCHNYLCIEADNELHAELVRLWNEALEQRQIGTSAVSARICTREPGSSVTLRTGPGIDHPMGLVQVGSGGMRIDNYFRQRNYTVEDGEEVSVFSKTHGTDGRVWYEIGTNQWVAWTRSDFVCQSPSEF